MAMISEEFLHLLNEELDNRKKEWEMAEARIKLYNKINVKDEDINMARFLSLSAKKKYEEVKKLLRGPLIARIEVASDEEIEDYKNEEINHKKNMIELYEKHIEDLKKKNKDRRGALDGVVESYSELNQYYDPKHLPLETSAFTLLNEIADNDECIEREEELIKDYKALIESLSKKNVQEMREYLIKYVASEKNRNNFYAFENKSTGSPAVELLASVAFDFDKSKKMLNLITEYKDLVDKRNSINEEIEPPSTVLNKKIWNGISKKWWSETEPFGKLAIYDADSLLRVFKKNVEIYNEDLEFFRKNYTIEKLEDLPKYYNKGMTTFTNTYFDYEMIEEYEFLEKHSDKIPRDGLDRLKAKIDQYKKLKCKLLVTEKAKYERKRLKQEIWNTITGFIGKIYTWYRDNNDRVKNIINGKEFVFYYNSLPSDIASGRIEEKIFEQKRAQDRFISDLESIAWRLRRDKAEYDPKIKELEKQIRELAGPEFANTNLSPIAKFNGTARDMFANAAIKVYDEELKDKIFGEAQKDANKEEARVTGKTIKDLMKERREKLLEEKGKIEIKIQDIPNNDNINRRVVVKDKTIIKSSYGMPEYNIPVEVDEKTGKIKM